MKLTIRSLVAASLCAASCSLSLAAEPAKKAAQDPVVLRFSTVGDSRQDPVSFDPTQGPLTKQDTIWLQNTKAWSRIMREIAAQKANMLFFNGDMIMGYGKAGPPASTAVPDVVGSDLMAFYRQYGFWRGMVATLMETGTYVVPVAGNHEVQYKKAGKKAQVENEDAWRDNMGDLIIDAGRFKSIVGQEATNINTQNNASADALASDQTQLSFSFDVADSHFAVVNTDPVGNDNVAPAAWLAIDLDAAKTRGAKHFFVFGHKPAFTYVYQKPVPDKVDPAGLDKFPAKRDAFWDVVEQFEATYFCGHEHMFSMSQPRGKAWHVLVGTGGSPWDATPGEATQNPATDRSYAWATVDIRKSGKVDIKAYAFGDTYGPTKLVRQVSLAQ